MSMSQLLTLKFFEKEDERRLARIQVNMIVFFLVFAFLALIINFLIWKNSALTSIIITGYLLHLAPLGLILKKKLSLSSFFLTGLYTILAVSLATVGGGLHDYIVMLFPIIIMFASLTAQKQGLIFSSVMALAGIGWLTIGEIAGWFVIHDSHTADATDLVIAVILITTIIWLANLSIAHSRYGLTQTWRELGERKQTEQALKEKNQELDRFFSTSLDLLCIADTNGFFRRLNLEWENTLGYSLDELQDKKFLDFVHPDDRTATLEIVSQLEAQKSITNFENRFRCKDGSYRWIEWRSKTFGKYIYAAARDVTRRRQIEEALRKSERRYRSLFNQTHDAVFILDLEGRHLHTNQRAADLLGYTTEEMEGLSVNETSGEREKSIEVLNRLKTGEMIAPYERWFRKKDGQLLPVEINLEMVRDETGQPMHIQSVVRDIRLRKQHEAEMQAANEQLQTQLQEIQSLQNALRQQALRDSLTGLYNRHYLEEIMPKEIARSRRGAKPLSAVIIDLDRLKNINDAYGHITGGDQAIRTLANVLKRMSREDDTIFRFGGDEFLVLLYDTAGEIALHRTRQWLHSIQKISIKAARSEFSISFSAGVAELTETDKHYEDILIRADQALYQAKENGKNQAILWTSQVHSD